MWYGGVGLAWVAGLAIVLGLCAGLVRRWRAARGMRLGRCGGCGYDLAGIATGPSARCPECGLGRDGRGIDGRRRMISWRAVTLGLGLLVAAWTACREPAVRKHGLIRLVPTAALVVWPESPNDEGYDWAAWELQKRTDEEVLSGWKAQLAAARFERLFRARAQAVWRVETFDLSGVSTCETQWEYYPETRTGICGNAPPEPIVECERSTSSARMLGSAASYLYLTGPDTAAEDYQGGWFAIAGQWLIVASTPERLDRVRSLLDSLARIRAGEQIVLQGDLILIAAPRRDQRPTPARSLMEIAVREVDTDSWWDEGGMSGGARDFENVVMMRTTQDRLRRIEILAAKLLASYAESSRTTAEQK